MEDANATPRPQPGVIAQDLAEHIDALEKLALQADPNAATQIRLGVVALRNALNETVGDYDTLTGRWVDDYAATRIGDQWVVVCENGPTTTVGDDGQPFKHAAAAMTHAEKMNTALALKEAHDRG